ncbi:MAG: YfhO family protein, partial [Anaerolineales bacterium]|nr:YfhO family protein [Anaerolineales bacterium]
MAFLKRRRADLWALVAIATAVTIFFWPVVKQQAWIPRGGGDLVSFLYPMYRFAARSLWHGEIPLWNPYLYAGAPFVSDNQSGLFYPINLLLFLLNPNFSYRTLQWLVLFHFWLAGTGMYVCLRGWQIGDRIRPFPALFAALTFMFSGVFIVHIGNLNLNAVVAWLPLALLALHRAIEAKTWRRQVQWAVGGGLLVSISTLAGHGQMTFMMGMFLGLYGMYRAVMGRNGRILLLLLIVGMVGIAGAAISLFPAVAQIQHTPRAGFDFAQSTNYSLPVKALVGLFAPNFYGRGIADFWGNWPRVEYGYAGVLSWLLAVVPFFTRQRRQALFFGIAGAFFLLLALGGNSPVYALLFEQLPIVPFQVPARFVVLADFCLAMLAGMGLDMLCKAWAVKRPRLWLAVTAVFLTTLAIYLIQQTNQLTILHPQRQAQMQTAVFTFITFGVLGWGLLAAYWRGWLSGKWLGITAVLLLAVDLISLGSHLEIEPGDPNPGFAAGSPALDFLLD